MFSKSSLGLAASVAFVAALLGMFFNERIKMPVIKSAAEQTVREEWRTGVDSGTAVVDANATSERVRGMCMKAANSGANIMPTDQFVLLCLEGIERDRSINKEGIASLREQALKDQKERLNKAASLLGKDT